MSIVQLCSYENLKIFVVRQRLIIKTIRMQLVEGVEQVLYECHCL